MDPQIIQSLVGLGFGIDTELDYETLVIPTEFQRELKPRNWDTFIPALFGRTTVCEVDGVNYLCDGFHRVEEGVLKGMWLKQGVPSVLFAGCTMQQAAAVFHLSNDSRIQLSAAVKFRAACIAGDEESLLLDAALLDLGLDGWCQNRAGKDLGAIGTVVALAEKYDREHTLYTLDTISECWSWEDNEDGRFADQSPNIRVIKGFGEYLRPEKRIGGRRRVRRWNRDNGPVLTSWIAANYPGEVGHESFILKAQARIKGGGGGGSAVGMELQIHDCFLKAKREEREAAEAA